MNKNTIAKVESITDIFMEIEENKHKIDTLTCFIQKVRNLGLENNSTFLCANNGLIEEVKEEILQTEQNIKILEAKVIDIVEDFTLGGE